MEFVFTIPLLIKQVFSTKFAKIGVGKNFSYIGFLYLTFHLFIILYMMETLFWLTYI